MVKETAKQKIQELVEKYEQVVKSGQLKKYSEEETKKDFILPLFESLGWDIIDKKEVSAEESIKSAGRVDYGFYLNSRPKFYLETKALKADLHKPEYANQAIRYSWNRGVSWAVLTDFESVKVFNAEAISKYLFDKMFFEIPYLEFAERFDQLWFLSKESFEQDLIDKEAVKLGKKMQKVPVGEKLYKDLNDCRDILTRDLATCNPKVNKDLLDEGIQKLLDRLIFLRVAEDRGIEKDTLKSLMRQWQGGGIAYNSMVNKFRELDKIYNSNLFTEHPFEKWEDYAGATEKVLKKLYGQEGYYEYDFKVMAPDVLGGVYESYLGHRLRQSKKGLTLAKDAKKRKEQGIYYTPDFIVDYIVKNALKPILDRCRSINDLKKIKVLDPACGSGSFLIKALNVIYDKYKEFNNTADESTVKLTILMENIYGVDLDEQAVEITQLNLLINALYRRERFPRLDHIKNGNSLISGADEELKKYFGKNFREKKPFNWQEEFPEVFKQGGFDVIIGNPPYIQSRNLNDEERHFYWDKYLTDTNHSDIYSFFIEKSINFLKNQGVLSFITPNTWLQTPSFKSVRKKVFEENKILKILTFDIDVRIFGDAQVSNVVFVFQRETDKNMAKGNHIDIEKSEIDQKIITLNKIKQGEINPEKGFNIFTSYHPQKILNKILLNSVALGTVGAIIGGLRTGDDKRFLKDKFENQDDKKLLRGRNVGRYCLKWNGEYIWYRPELMKAKQAAAPKESKFFEVKEKLLVRMITGGELIVTFDDKGFYFLQDNLILPKEKYNIKYLLAILNSKLSGFIVKNSVSNIAITQSLLKQFPICKIDFSSPKEKAKHDELVNLADKMLKLNKELQKIPENSNKWNSIKSEIEKTDKKIDEEVYKLYGLTDEEIGIVEEKNNAN